jgi:polyisoprenoid-binding protein YceI
MQADAAEVAVTAAENDAVIYRVKPRESRFIVQAFAEGLLSAFGHNPKLAAREFAGEVKLNRSQLDTSTLEFSVKADSLVVTNDVSEKDRRELERVMKDEVLETSRFPDITFRSKSVTADRIYEGFYRVKITGELTLHGIAREYSIEAQLRLMENGVRAEGESTLRQSYFGIKRVSIAGGTLKVKDEVKMTFLIVAEKP